MKRNARLLITTDELLEKLCIYLSNVGSPHIDYDRDCISIAFHDPNLPPVEEGCELLPVRLHEITYRGIGT